jgi:dinuclear metal center YbgI/SA1388 family protein
MACTRDQLREFLDALLHPTAYTDYCPNGLQVEGKSQIKHLVTGVTASQALVDAAIADEADAILVHHGYFWRSEDPCVVGMKAQRLRALLAAEISLFAYHLPLDCHPELGNNVTLGRLIGVSDPLPLVAGDANLPLYTGRLPAAIQVEQLANKMAAVLEREPLVIGEGAVQKLVWCTGAGQGYIDRAADAGAHVFITGEISEQTVHVARERGVAFIAAGHHATERYGVQAVGERVASVLGCTHRFVDSPNPA